MALNPKPPYTQKKNVGNAKATAANAVLENPANAVLLFTAGADGSLLMRTYARPLATVTATQLQLFRSTDAGATKKLWKTVLMAGYVMNQTTNIPETPFDMSKAEPAFLVAGERIYAAIGVALAAGIQFIAEGEDF